MNIYDKGCCPVRIKYENVINILLKLWELVNPNAHIRVNCYISSISIRMVENKHLYESFLEISDWNSKSADFNYIRLQNVLLMLHNRFVIDCCGKGDKLWQCTEINPL